MSRKHNVKKEGRSRYSFRLAKRGLKRPPAMTQYVHVNGPQTLVGE